MPEPPLDEFILRAEFKTQSPETESNDDAEIFTREIHATLIGEDEGEKDHVLGTSLCRFVDVHHGHYEANVSFFDLFDCYSQELHDVSCAIFNFETGDYWDDLDDCFIHGHNVLFIEEVKLTRDEKELMPRFLKLIIDIAGTGCGVLSTIDGVGIPEDVLLRLGFVRSSRIPHVFLLNTASPGPQKAPTADFETPAPNTH